MEPLTGPSVTLTLSLVLLQVPWPWSGPMQIFALLSLASLSNSIWLDAEFSVFLSL